MAVDKLVDSTQLDTDLTSVANAIRTKGGTSAQLAFPAGFVQAIDAIPTGGGTTPFSLLSTVNVQSGVSSIEVSLPSGYDEFGLVFDLPTSASTKKTVYHTSVASSRNMLTSNTAATWVGSFKIIQIDKDALGDTQFTANRTAAFGNEISTSGSAPIQYSMPSVLLISTASSSVTFTGGTIKVYGR